MPARLPWCSHRRLSPGRQVAVHPRLLRFAAVLFLETASAARKVLGDDIWGWVERTSWIAAILGLLVIGFVAWQITQLLRRPELRLGFPYDPGGRAVHLVQVRDEEEITAAWNRTAKLSDPVQIAVAAVNDGDASAQDMDLEVRYPIWLVPDGKHELRQPPGVNAWSFFRHGLVLNPRTSHFMRATFRIPSGRTEFRLHVIASMRDTRPIDKTLRVLVRGDSRRRPT